MPEVARRYTVAEVLAFPEDGKRYELIRGELYVSPAPLPRHQALVGRLYWRLVGYLDGLGLRHTLFMGPADISWDDETLVQPDLLVVPPEEVTSSWTSYRTLLLGVEVLSPSSPRRDRVDKRRLYQEHRVATYWIVDSEAGLVEVWHPDDDHPAIVTGALGWRVRPEAVELMIDVGELCAGLP